MPAHRQQIRKSRHPRATADPRAVHPHRAYLDAILASERELGRLGRELHDGVCQELAGIAFEVEALRKKLENGTPVGMPDLIHVVSLLQDATRHSRSLSHGLYPVSPGPKGLATALDELAAAVSDLNGLECRFQSKQAIDPGESTVATHLFRIAQEAVRDAIHRGLARRIRIELSATRDVITLRIIDDGRSLEADGRLRADMAMQLMRHRADVIGAQLSVRSASSGGVSVVCRLPRHIAKT